MGSVSAGTLPSVKIVLELATVFDVAVVDGGEGGTVVDRIDVAEGGSVVVLADGVDSGALKVVVVPSELFVV